MMTAPDRVRPVRARDLVLPTEAPAWLLHPITVGSLALLLVNDHLLKAAWPGVVTGKLSDFAGLALAPPTITAVLALLLPRLPVRVVAATATLIVGIVFCLVKVTMLGAAWASAGWSWAAGPSTVLRDPTDLLALPALAASWWAFAHVRRHPLPGRAASLVLTAIVLPVAGLAILATTPAPYPSVSEVIVMDGPKLVVNGSDIGEFDAMVTTDGDSWSNLPESEVWRPPGEGQAQKACVPADPSRCYRTVPGRLAVEQTDDGGATWNAAWSISPGRQKFLARAHPDYGMGALYVAAQSIGVLPVGDQHVVVVAARDEGVVLRHSDGRWERLGFPTLGHRDFGDGPTIAPAAMTAPGQRIGIEYAYLALGLSGGLLLGGLAASSRRPRASWWAIPLVTVGFSYFIVMVSGMGVLLGVLSSVSAVLTLIAVALVLWLTIVWSTGALTFRRAVVFAALAVIAFALDRRPIVEWSSGQIDSYEAAVRTATQLVAGSVIAMTLVGLAFRVRDHVRPPEAPIAATGGNAG